MATELGKAYVQIIPSARGIEGSIEKELQGESASAGKSAGMSIAGAMKTAFVAAGIGKALVSIVKEGGKLEQSLGGIETLFKDNADKVKEYANDAYKTAGLSANAYMENVTSFSASLLQSLGGDTSAAADKANTAMIDMADNANKMGTDIESIQNAYQGFAKQNYTMLDNLKLGYGGTKTEMERLLSDAQELSGVEYDINNLSDVYDAIHVVQTELGITGTTAKEANETIMGSFSALQGAFQNVLGSLALGENITPSLQALAETISVFLFDNLLPMAGNVLINLPTGLLVFVEAMLPKLMEIGQKLLTGIGDGIRNDLPNILQQGVDIILNLSNGILNASPEALTSIGDLLIDIISAIIDAAPIVLEKGFELIAGLAQGLLDNAPAVMSSITDILFKLVDLIIQKAPTLLSEGMRLTKEFSIGLYKSLPDVITTIAQILSDLIAKIIEHYPEMLNTGIELLIVFGSGLMDALPDLVATIPDIINALVDAILSLTGQLVDAGRDLMLGLAQGIGDSVGTVVAEAQAAAGEVLGSVKDFFGIRSPSRVFMGIGEFLNLGLAKGIKDNLKPVSDAISSLQNEAMFDLRTNPVENEIISRASANKGFVAKEHNLSDKHGQYTINIKNMHVNDPEDAKIIAKELRRLQLQAERGLGYA